MCSLLFFCSLCPRIIQEKYAVVFGVLVSEYWLWNMFLMESDFFLLCLQEVHAVGVHGPAANLQGRLQCRVWWVPLAARPCREHHSPLHPAGCPVSEAGTWHQRAPGQSSVSLSCTQIRVVLLVTGSHCCQTCKSFSPCTDHLVHLCHGDDNTRCRHYVLSDLPVVIDLRTHTGWGPLRVACRYTGVTLWCRPGAGTEGQVFLFFCGVVVVVVINRNDERCYHSTSAPRSAAGARQHRADSY